MERTLGPGAPHRPHPFRGHACLETLSGQGTCLNKLHAENLYNGACQELGCVLCPLQTGALTGQRTGRPAGYTRGPGPEEHSEQTSPSIPELHLRTLLLLTAKASSALDMR